MTIGRRVATIVRAIAVPDAPSCKCELGCPAIAVRTGYDRQMKVVPVAAGHGRKEDGSWHY